jgi:hypothetical protein
LRSRAPRIAHPPPQIKPRRTRLPEKHEVLRSIKWRAIGQTRVKVGAMNAATPVVNVDEKTVTHGGRTFVMRPLAEDSYTIMEAGIPVGRAVFTFGAANGVPESSAVTEDFVYEIAEAWFAAIET